MYKYKIILIYFLIKHSAHSADSFCLHQQMTLTTSGRYCHMTLLTDSESTKGGLDWTGTPAWTSQLSSSNWCHMIQKGHVTPTAISCYPLTKVERFCWKFGNLSTIIWLCVQNFSSEIMFPVQKHSLPNFNIIYAEPGRSKIYSKTEFIPHSCIVLLTQSLITLYLCMISYAYRKVYIDTKLCLKCCIQCICSVA